ncbi:MAG TPA: protein kinase [Pyrinomonadaceae bacterium]|jgi:serine/threonine protein kinase
MKLAPQTKIGKYKIRSLIGSGGMGEVYAAYDTELERQVALKLLKQSDDREKLRRFRQEAKAVSALNHPNILTVYDFGQYENFHFIVTELIEGVTLREKISEADLSTAEILDIGVQTGNALAAAHRARVIHRDIKPENIMLLPDGYVKVLDFGLAKLVGINDELASNSDASTASLIQTKAGMIIGTVNYMSPEQLRGRELDERTDIWSLGIVLFEMFAGQKPFRGDSVSDVIAAVLERPLPALPDFAPQISPEIEEIVKKALEKDKEKRFRTAKELVLTLKTAGFFNTGESRRVFPENSLPSDTNPVAVTDSNRAKTVEAQENLLTSSEKVKGRWRSVALAALLVLSAVGVWLYAIQSRPKLAAPPKDKKSKLLAASGNVVDAVISPDGSLVAYVQNDGEKKSLWFRQTDEIDGTGKKLIPNPDFGNYKGLAFAPNSKMIYYLVFDRNAVGSLYRVSITSDAAQLIAKNVDSSVSFSPDGAKIAFLRRKTAEGVEQIIISDADGGNPQILSEKRQPEFFSATSREAGLAWSPDGKTIACPKGARETEGERMSVAGIDAETRQEKEFTAEKWAHVGKIAWTNDGTNLIFTADGGKNLYQILRLSRETGKTEKIGDDLSDYKNISISSDGKFLLAVKGSKNSTIFKAGGDFGQPVAIGQSNTEVTNGLAFSPAEKILFVSNDRGNRDVWQMDADGENRAALTFDKAAEEYPSISADGKYVVYVSAGGGAHHIWRMNADGSDRKQITNQTDESFPQISPDGKFVIYSSKAESHFALWKAAVDGTAPLKLSEGEAHWAAISPDGKLIACLARIKDARASEADDADIKLAVISAENGKLVKFFDAAKIHFAPDFPPVLRWTRDGKNVAYISTADGVSNILAQSLAGGEPRRLTDFSIDMIFSFDWSPDGKQVVYARGAARSDIVLFEEF